MKVKELIAVLSRLDQEMKVFVAYDSMVCISDLKHENFCMMDEAEKSNRYDPENGLYLCADGAGWQYEENFKPLPK